MTIKPYQKLSSKKLIDNRFIKLFEDEFISGNGKQGKYYYFSYNNDVVHGLGIDKARENFILTKEYRYPVREVVVQVAGGVIEESENPMNSAKRELFEETGYKGEKVVDLGKSSVDASKCINWLYEYLILDCEKVGEPHDGESTEVTEVVLLPVNEAWEWIKSGKIPNPHSSITLAKALIYLGVQFHD